MGKTHFIGGYSLGTSLTVEPTAGKSVRRDTRPRSATPSPSTGSQVPRTHRENPYNDTVTRLTASSLIQVVSRTILSTQNLSAWSFGAVCTLTPSAEPL